MAQEVWEKIEAAPVERAIASDAADQAARAARQSAAEALLTGSLRLRAAKDLVDVGVSLLEAASDYCGRAALLMIEEKTLLGWRATGFRAGFDVALATFRLALRDAPAVFEAVETRHPVVIAAAPDSLSPALFDLLRPPAGQLVCLFPLAPGTTAIAVLYADSAGSAQGVEPTALELLCAVAEASIGALSANMISRRPVDPDVIRVTRATAPPPPPDISRLSPAERDLHHRAQRFARILVADLQLHRAQQIREGRKAADLYGLLRVEIDQSREAYRRKFAGSNVASVDYFHQELVRTLAGDQEALLGPDYPGRQSDS